MTIIFGLLSAFSYGYADFFGALAAKRIRALTVTTVSFTAGLILALLLSGILGAEYSDAVIRNGVLAGVCSAVAISCLYAALALGPISIVSPLTAVISAVIPVVIDVFLGEALSSFAAVAIGLILIAVILVAFVPGQAVRLPSLAAVLYSLGAGFGFSGIFVFLDATPSSSGLAPLIIMRVVGLLLLVLGLISFWIKSGRKLFIEKETFSPKLLGLIFLAGTGDVLGNVFFLVATREGALAIAAVLTALYPIGTILLARVVLKEKIAISQTVGIALGLGAVALLALS